MKRSYVTVRPTGFNQRDANRRTLMTTSTKGTALVTGASSGIVERDPDQEYSFRDDAPTGCEGNALVEPILEVSE